MRFPARIMQQWYRKHFTLFTASLLPLSLLFGVAAWIRRWLYSCGLKKQFVFEVPVIVVGNLTVGGTGKTPIVIWLADYFRARGFRPAIVARGVGGCRLPDPVRVSAGSDPHLVGDEAVLLARRTGCPVMIGIDRVAAVRALVDKTDCNLVISDDGLQHYRLGRTIEIILIDSKREFGNRALLPAGPLRESPRRLEKAEFVWVKGRDFLLEGETLHAVRDETHCLPVSAFASRKVHAIAAIGHPERFFDNLRAFGLEVIPHAFPDHFLFQSEDIFFADELPVIMTEKDAVKCRDFAGNQHWFLPVSVVPQQTMASLLPQLESRI